MASAAELEQGLIDNYVVTSVNVLFLYESIITLSEEVNVIWCRNWNTMTWLYAFTRYSTVVLSVLAFVPTGTAIKSCEAGIYTYDVLVLIQFPCFTIFSALRVYALLGGKYIMAGLVLLLNLVPLGANMFDYITGEVVADSEVCTEFFSGSARLSLMLSLISRISVIVADLLVLLVTWMKTAQSYREARRLGIEAPLATMLIRDGTVYFLMLLLLNILQVFGQNITALFAWGVVQLFCQVIPPLIICRFILDLRQVKPAGSSWVSGNQSHSLRFVGNMGETLQFGGDDDEDSELVGDERPAQADILPDITIVVGNLHQNKEGGDTHVRGNLDVQQGTANARYDV